MGILRRIFENKQPQTRQEEIYKIFSIAVDTVSTIKKCRETGDDPNTYIVEVEDSIKRLMQMGEEGSQFALVLQVHLNGVL
ncbi:MAG: hypothetical protein DKINENOH_03863 [bacterium]|nr:hypothetical protein [bacterium]